MINLKRVYEPAAKSDGYRILVDRLWPRGISKAEASIDLWLKDIGPSNELRKWFGHDPAKFKEFSQRYRAELDINPATDQVKEIITEHREITLLYGAKDEQHNQAVVLMQYLTS